MSDLKFEADAKCDFSEWTWNNILDEAHSLVRDIEDIIMEALEADSAAGLSYNEGKLVFSVGLPMKAGDWVWGKVNFDELVAEIADPDYMEDENKKAVAAIFRKWADVLDPNPH